MKMIKYILICFTFLQITSCSEDILNEKPLDFLGPENSYVKPSDFQSAINQLYAQTRTLNDGKYWTTTYLQFGTDIAMYPTSRSATSYFNNYTTGLTEMSNPGSFWDKYYKLIFNSNVILSRIEAVTYSDEAEKTLHIAEARFFRGYAYRCLTHLYGGVPIIEEEITSPRRDFVRATKEESYAFAIADLTFAAENLPDIAAVVDGKTNSAAAKHFLSELYLATGDFDNAIKFSSEVIDNPATGLMTTRFGSRASEEGDPFWDLFQIDNQNRASGNKEGLFVIQVDFSTLGGGAENSMNYNNGNALSYERNYGPAYWTLKCPDGKNVGPYATTQAGGRPVGFVTPTYHQANGVWKSDWNTDIRNNPRNIQREWTVYNTDSEWYGKSTADFPQEWRDNLANIDTMERYTPYFTKVTTMGTHPDYILLNQTTGEMSSVGGITYHDWYLIRLAETYLIRAEAYLGKGDKTNAAKDINVVRERAQATPATADEIDIDYILDERMRELNWEEPRRMTLSRLGKDIFLRRVREHNLYSGATIEDKHVLFPIPYSEIEKNTAAELTQNPGY